MVLTAPTAAATVDHPRAIAIVLGHLGVTAGQLHQLSTLYSRRGCAVVTARSPPLDFFLAHHGRLRPVAAKVVSDTAALIRRSQSPTTTTTTTVPVVIHVFSNGGAFLLEELDRMDAAKIKQHDKADNDDDDDDLALVRRHVRDGYVFYDSCPCYLHMPWRLLPQYWRDAFPFPGWSPWGRQLYLTAASVGLGLWCLLTASPSRSKDFWSVMSRPPLGINHLVYCYTTNDKVTDASMIDALIESQRSDPRGPQVTAYRYDDSSHVRLVVDHRDEYERAIDQALDGAVARARDKH